MIISSLVETIGWGFAVMSGCLHGITSAPGNSITRQGISLVTVTCEPDTLFKCRAGWSFPPTSPRRHGGRTISSTHQGWRVGRRMVSEDSQVLRWFPLIHRLSDRGNFCHAERCQVNLLGNLMDDARELVEVFPLRSSQLVGLKERNDYLDQIAEAADAVNNQVLFVIVLALVRVRRDRIRRISSIPPERPGCWLPAQP